MDDQDWTVVTLRSAKRQKVSEGSVPARYTTGNSDLRKVAEAETGKPKFLSPKSRADMAASRTAKKLTQKQLDMSCSFPANSVNAFESGRICPSRAHIQSIQRVLGIKLELE